MPLFSPAASALLRAFILDSSVSISLSAVLITSLAELYFPDDERRSGEGRGLVLARDPHAGENAHNHSLRAYHDNGQVTFVSTSERSDQPHRSNG